MLIDTHCHLNFHAFKDDLDEVITRAQKAGIEKIIIPGTDLSSSAKAIAIAQKYPHCYAAIGIHPHHAKDATITLNQTLRNQLKELTQHDKVVAVGEIGMDYHTYEKSKYAVTAVTPEVKEKQKALFLLQLEFAHECNLPVIFHCREAHEDMYTLIVDFKTHSGWKPQGVYHCFGGGKKDLKRVLELGLYVGCDGNVTYNESLQTVVKEIPLERLLLETDAPFLTPLLYRGTRNEPSYLPLIAQKVAELKGVEEGKVKEMTTKNARTLFKLP